MRADYLKKMRDLRCSKKEEKYIKTKILNFVPFQKEKLNLKTVLK